MDSRKILIKFNAAGCILVISLYALACEGRVAEKKTTMRHKHRYCSAIFLFLKNQTRNSWPYITL